MLNTNLTMTRMINNPADGSSKPLIRMESSEVVSTPSGQPSAMVGRDDPSGSMALSESLHESQKYLRLVVDTLPDRIYWKNRESVYLGCNQLFAQDAGFSSPTDLIGKSDFDLAWHDQAMSHQKDDQMLMETGKARLHYEEPRMTAHGRVATWRSSKLPLRDNDGKVIGLLGTYEDITEKLCADELLRLQQTALCATANVVVITDRRGNVVWTNPAFTHVTGYTSGEILGKNPRIMKSGNHPPAFYEEMWKMIASGQVWHGEFNNRRKDGTIVIEEATITPVRNENGRITHFIAVKQDITARKSAEQERAMLEVQLRHAQKLESIGQLAAGIAHEINTPTQYVGDNLRFVQESISPLMEALDIAKQMLQAARDGKLTSELISSVETRLANADLDYLTTELPKAVSESLDGVERVSKIVRAMKEFSHPGSEQKTLVDLNKAIDSTLTVARNEWKYVAELVTDYDGNLPRVSCLPGEFNQVILNLVVNASHAISDAIKGNESTKGKITASTRRDGDWVEVRISDTGTGIPDHARCKIFEPFFTTKGVGKGTGQGLAISRSVIVDKHGGTIDFHTETGKGTVFIIRLPLQPQRQREGITS